MWTTESTFLRERRRVGKAVLQPLSYLSYFYQLLIRDRFRSLFSTLFRENRHQRFFCLGYPSGIIENKIWFFHQPKPDVIVDLRVSIMNIIISAPKIPLFLIKPEPLAWPYFSLFGPSSNNHTMKLGEK